MLSRKQLENIILNEINNCLLEEDIVKISSHPKYKLKQQQDKDKRSLYKTLFKRAGTEHKEKRLGYAVSIEYKWPKRSEYFDELIGTIARKYAMFPAYDYSDKTPILKYFEIRDKHGNFIGQPQRFLVDVKRQYPDMIKNITLSPQEEET